MFMSKPNLVFNLGKVSLEKKNMNFHTFGPDPPQKSVKLKNFIFFHTLTETYCGKKNVFFHL